MVIKTLLYRINQLFLRRSRPKRPLALLSTNTRYLDVLILTHRQCRHRKCDQFSWNRACVGFPFSIQFFALMIYFCDSGMTPPGIFSGWLWASNVTCVGQIHIGSLRLDINVNNETTASASPHRRMAPGWPLTSNKSFYPRETHYGS